MSCRSRKVYFLVLQGTSGPLSVYSIGPCGNAWFGFVSPSEDLPCPLPTRGREVSTNYITGMLKRALSGPGQKETSSFPTEEPGPGGIFFFPFFPFISRLMQAAFSSCFTSGVPSLKPESPAALSHGFTVPFMMFLFQNHFCT